MDVKDNIKSTVNMIGEYYYVDSDCDIVTKFNKYSKVYPFTNELINRYYKKFNYNGNILTVAASGDYILNSILMGCKDINVFDVNVLTYYYISLKIAAAKEINLAEFLDYFTCSDGVTNGFPRMTYRIFKKFEHLLDKDVREYWNTMYETYRISYDLNGDSENGFYFQRAFFFLDGDFYNNDYLMNNASYSLLQENIKKDRKIKFYNMDLLDLNDDILDNKYSSIFLSNILYYFKDDVEFKNILLQKLVPTLSDDGIIMYNYSWDSKECRYHGDNFGEFDFLREKAFVYSKNKKFN